MSALLSPAEVQVLCRLGTKMESLWDDIEHLGARVFDTNLSSRDQVLAWHHLLLAVGNFKRQGGTKIHPPRLVTNPVPSINDRREVLELPDGRTISVKDASTWHALTKDRHAPISETGTVESSLEEDTTKIPGIAEATATALLAALWPDQHVIMDVNALSAAVGLAVVESDEPVEIGDHRVGAKSTEPIGAPSWDHYPWYRETVLSSASMLGRRPLEVERALFQLYRRERGENGRHRNRTWKDYGRALRQTAERAVSGDTKAAPQQD